ncbi:virulence factor Mce family protein [Mycolicibacterium austroafricanum]|jgi:phospholipid/cholesterol/gamma-HCH transport system substrate-binding protein|uniref:Virulence factor Mce family protein n=1 Tax=Mycolicibacterium austroafricanum TaxID=39687 RepID=A0ABT8H6V2_MYCAO|nr:MULTISPECIES: virulence factor Mce family protein [Mycolicibacterium]MDN4516493.1 virulence factor Mce family protein [Mycolicibacterium austroafricanum]QRZ07143.1 virulence factor Mce family protein [Mycolicibacterium austroafricanum]QZT68628.1 virulence factor Mce family protein [Mycolicibacterium austroafricanum]UJL29872.1 virulence factor Mce family protein [Mycolicibacterium vanbaalenii]WND57068.1 virulence factor Mce family protein [Mycolicibacterium vanbaalenii]
MSTVFNVRNLKSPGASRATLIIGVIVVVLAVVGAVLGWNLYKQMTTKTVVAYFTQTLAIYPGDKVQIMGVQVGSIDKIEPAGDKMKVTFHYAGKYKVPQDATASILNPSLVASRTIQLSPPYTGGPVLADGAVLDVDRTQVPVEYDDVRDSISRLLTDLGPTPEQPKGPFGDIIESAADGFAGKGKQLNSTLNNLSEALFALNEGRGDFFSVVKSLALFVNALHQSDQQFVALNNDLAQFTNAFTDTDREVADALRDLNELLTTTRNFVDENGEVLAHDVQNLAEVTNAILQPEPLDGLETALHAYPNVAANLMNISSQNAGGIVTMPVISNFANPMQFLCSAIQAGSRLGYQESAELCAQYLGPILDAIKFNYLPFGANQLQTAMTLPKQIAYSEERLRPPPGYKDTTVPGIFSRDTLFSHGNHEPGWVVAPGMQGVEVQPFTQNMLTPESLAELMGGPDIVPPPAPPAFGTTRNGNLPGPPNAFDQNNPLPPPWYPQPGPPPAPAPGVVQGNPLGAIAPAAPPAGPAPAAPSGPLLPAEAGG